MLTDFARYWLPRTQKPQRIWSGMLRGHRIVTSWHDFPRAILGKAEPRLLKWLVDHVEPGETWIDVGAHYGYVSLALAHLVGGRGRVFAFEALPRTAGNLAATKMANQLQQLVVVPLALGSGSEIRRVDLCARRNMAEWNDEQGATKESVFVVAFDHIWPHIAHNDTTISGIKIDVQGLEADVVRGMAEHIRRHKPKLVVELHSGVDRNEFRSLVRELGYCETPRKIEPLPDEAEDDILDDRNYEFFPAE